MDIVGRRYMLITWEWKDWVDIRRCRRSKGWMVGGGGAVVWEHRGSLLYSLSFAFLISLQSLHHNSIINGSSKERVWGSTPLLSYQTYEFFTTNLMPKICAMIEPYITLQCKVFKFIMQYFLAYSPHCIKNCIFWIKVWTLSIKNSWIFSLQVSP